MRVIIHEATITRDFNEFSIDRYRLFRLLTIRF